jgi:hypothetical protein
VVSLGEKADVSRLAKYCRVLIAAVVLAPASAPAAAADSAPEVSFRLDEGLNINSFTRDGAIAAHLLLRSSKEPRTLVAFPAGNSGVGLWFAATDEPVTWKLVGSPRAIALTDAGGRPLRGIEARGRLLSSRAIRRAPRGRGRVQRRSALEHGVPRGVSALARPFADGLPMSARLLFRSRDRDRQAGVVVSARHASAQRRACART